MVAYNNIRDYCYCPCHRLLSSVVPGQCLCMCNKINPYTNASTKQTSIGIMDTNEAQEIDVRLKAIERFIKGIINEAVAKDIVKEEDKRKNPFEFKQVNSKGRDDIRHIANLLHDFYKWIIINVPENKERSIAVTHLEDAAMWLNKSISRRKEQ